MGRVNILFFLFVSLRTVCGGDLFHVKSKITFSPDYVADYFGYSVMLSELGLIVGAPKARTFRGKSAPGVVFKCPVTNLDNTNVTCGRLGVLPRSTVMSEFYVDDMWYGATLGTVPNKKLLVCAPRVTTPYQGNRHLLANGVCTLRGNDRELAIKPLSDKVRQAYRTDGSRKVYGEYDSHMNYFAYGQSGMSVKVTENNTIIIGAPGVLQWTGAVIEYKFSPSTFFLFRLPNQNPYFTTDLGPDDYFGYSVESGIFEESGLVLYVGGAPRSKGGYGQVLVFTPSKLENEPLNVRVKLVGPQLGSYFGASLCAADLDGDGLSDLLVGAPNYAMKEGVIRYDQGAVFVYLSRKEDFRFVLQGAGFVRGSGASGARFGTAIAELGDIDGDGYHDIAIGAPWENEGMGVVYVYRGTSYGLNNQYSQRIFAEGAMGFGISISKGYDADNNKCNDLAIGAHKSRTVFVYRGIPTLQVMSSIKVPNAKNLSLSVSSFPALFCIIVPPNHSWSDLEINLRATVSVDPEGNRANTLGESDFIIIAKSGVDRCEEQIIEVNNETDLSKPILLKFDLQPVTDLDDLTKFPSKTARLADESALHSSFYIQLVRDCGEDLVCIPWLEVTMTPFVSPFVPGIESKLGAKVKVLNTEEPAYSVKLRISLPCSPKRLPRSCSLENLDLICDLPAPLKRNESVEWDVELDYGWKGSDDQLKLTAMIEDALYSRNISTNATELVIPITPKSNYTFRGRSEPNRTIVVSRETFYSNGDVFFSHYHEVTNRGPSDCYRAKVAVTLPEEVTLSDSIDGTRLGDGVLTFEESTLRANARASYILPLRFNISGFGNKLDEESSINITTTAYFFLQNYHGSVSYNVTQNITTTLLLEPNQQILWPLIVGIVGGLLVLCAIILALYKFGFFSRKKKEELKQLLDNSSSQEDPNSSPSNRSATECNSTNDMEMLESD